MSLSINYNASSAAGQRQLGATSSALAKNTARLSSGLRVNGAADDPAGLVISQKLRAQASGLGQAIKNAGDATNLVKTAEGALGQVHNLLNSMRDLALHAANTGATDSASAQADQSMIANAIDSLNKIASETQFGDRKLLDGSAGVRSFVNGSNVMAGNFSFAANIKDGANVSIQVTKAAEKATLSSGATYSKLTTGTTSTAATFANATAAMGALGTMLINGSTVSYSASDTVDDVVTAINALKTTTGVEASFNTTTNKIDFTSTKSGSAGTFTVTQSADKGIQSTAATFAGTTAAMGAWGTMVINGTTVAYATADTVADVLTAINAVKTTTGVEATFNATTNKIDLTSTVAGTAGDFTVTQSTGGTLMSADTSFGTGTSMVMAANSNYGTGTNVGTFANADGSMYLNGVKINYSSGDDVNTFVNNVNAKSSMTGVEASFNEDTNKIDFKSVDYGSKASINVTTGTMFLGAGKANDSDTGVDAEAKITQTVGGVTTNVSDNSWKSGDGLTLKDSLGNSVILTEAGGSSTSAASSQFTIQKNTLTFQVGAFAGQTRDVNINSMFSHDMGNGAVADKNVSTIDVTTAQGAQDAIKILDKAISDVSNTRASLGATQTNVLESSVNSLTVAKENISASMSSITDTDIAAEMSDFTKNQMLSQAGVSMLAQANQAPQMLMKLIG